MIKNLIYIAAVGVAFTSCSALKPVSSNRVATAKHSPSAPEFINSISISPSSVVSSKKTAGTNKAAYQAQYASSVSLGTTSATETLSSLQFKYGIMLNVAVEQLTNLKLLETIDEWYGSRYRYGGTTKAGVDCSAFAGALMTAVFGSNLPRTAKDQYASSQRIEKNELQEGDLVFFNTRGGISHVGVYLENNKFVHASTSSGVMISDLNEGYFLNRYVGAGRILN